MRLKILLVSLVTVLLSFNFSFAMAEDNLAQNSVAQPANSSQEDAQVLGTLIAINKGEVDAGRLAESQSTNPDVKKFAKMMQHDHTHNLKATEALAKKLGIQPVDSSFTMDLQKKGEEEATKLKSLTGAEFNQEYANAMVKGHEGALAFLNDALTKVKNVKLIDHLKATRKKVEQHLKLAKELSQKVSKSQ
jgi:putative membrane protein